MRLDVIKAFVNVRSQMNVVGVIENTTHLAVVTAFSETRELVEPDEFSFRYRLRDNWRKFGGTLRRSNL